MTNSQKEFFVKHYVGDGGATIKYDGGYIEIVGDREDAEEFLSAIYDSCNALWERKLDEEKIAEVLLKVPNWDSVTTRTAPYFARAIIEYLKGSE